MAWDKTNWRSRSPFVVDEQKVISDLSFGLYVPLQLQLMVGYSDQTVQLRATDASNYKRWLVNGSR